MTLDAWVENHRNLLSRIQIKNKQKRFKIFRESIAFFCASALQALDQPDKALSIVFVGVRTMRSLNRYYRHKNYATDVLSFSYGEVLVDRRSFLGEIVIAPEVALSQAIRYRICPQKELRKLFVHGILHLLGYDHETDQGQMNCLQKKLLRRKFFVDAPLLAEMKGVL
jgi:probable rRNA maturation factor